MIDFLIFIPAIVFHELGHYLAYRYYGYKPDLKFSKGTFWIGDNITHSIKVKEMKWITWSGIILGLPFIMFDIYFILVYAVMCCVDISHLISYSQVKPEHVNKTTLEVAELQIKEIKQKIKQQNSKTNAKDVKNKDE